MSELELMAAHCDALYIHNERLDLVCVNDWLHRPAPALWMGFTREGILYRFREDVCAATRARIERLIGQETCDPASRLPRFHDAYRSLIRSEETIAGPTFRLPALSGRPDRRVQRISAANAKVVRDSGLEAWTPDIPHQQPMFVSLENGSAVSVCASVRSTSVAHEAGVETLPHHRRRGHAAAVVAAWAQELLGAGILPLYSTSWDNQASQRVARHLGFEAFGQDYRIG